MTIYENIKANVSMKQLNEDYFFCFGCGETGDVIDFAARLVGQRNFG